MKKPLDPSQEETGTENQVSESRKASISDIRFADVHLDDLIGKGLKVLHREIQRLLIASAKDPLSKDNQIALVNYMRLFKDLKKDEKVLLDNLTEDELREVARRADIKESSS